MTLGEKLKKTRKEAGLSQRQVCGTVITRNMLSLIESGSAQPSVETLQYLAAQLGKSAGYFLDDEAVLSPNIRTMESLRKAVEDEGLDEAMALLSQMVLPDPVFAWEFQYLQGVVLLAAAERALKNHREGYARELLENMPEPPTPDLQRRKLLLQGAIPGSDLPGLCRGLASLDEELMLRAQAAAEEKNYPRAAALLDGAERQNQPQWCLLRGKLYLKTGDPRKAAALLLQAEKAFPQETVVLLEQCFRELGDYQRAYYYACRRRGDSL